MINVHVSFSFRSKSWTRDFAVELGTTARSLREVMLKGKGTKADVDSFELRQQGLRLPDYKFLWKEVHLDFKYLGLERGQRRAAKDAQFAADLVQSGGKAISVEAALRLQDELIDGFSSSNFQGRFKELQDKLQAVNERRFNVEKQKLFLSVQKVVLPCYGFSDGHKGVFEMLETLNDPRFQVSLEFQRNGIYLQMLLGYDVPPDQRTLVQQHLQDKRLHEREAVAAATAAPEVKDAACAAADFSGFWLTCLPEQPWLSIKQDGSQVTTSGVSEMWTTEGSVSGIRITLWSIAGTLDGNEIRWDENGVWYRLLDPHIDIQYDLLDENKVLPLNVPAGSTYSWIKEQICKADPRAALQPDQFILFPAGMDTPIEDDSLVLGDINRILVRFEQHHLESTTTPQLDEATPPDEQAVSAGDNAEAAVPPAGVPTHVVADASAVEEQPRSPQSPQSPQPTTTLFDFHDLEDERSPSPQPRSALFDFHELEEKSAGV